MRLLLFILLLGVLILTVGGQGHDLTGFMAKHKADIENFVMAGYGGGWDHCDVLTDYYHEGDSLEKVPQLIIELEKLKPPENPASNSGNFLI